MPENYYNDGPEEAPAAAAPEAPEKPDEGEQSADQTALLPKSILAGKEFNVGDEVVLKIDAIHEDSVQVSYAPEKGKEEGGEGGEGEGAPAAAAPAPGGDSEMASYMG